ncbi:hypothetical protein KAR91_43550 [Candidatus Pacearchaeota archaeon]|nr:hypothetical protein [Candidatus Pacearchaeota archaeon]
MPEYPKDFFKHALGKRTKVHLITETHFWKWCSNCGEWYEVKDWTIGKKKPVYCIPCKNLIRNTRNRENREKLRGLINVLIK